MNAPADLTVLLRHTTTYLAEIGEVLRRAGIRSFTGALPGSG